MFDDHEVDNNWAGEIPEKPHIPQPDFPARCAAALQAYRENMPLRRAQRPQGTDMQLYRRVGRGSLASFHMLDTRQYRGDQPCGDRFNTECADRTDPVTSSITSGGDGSETRSDTATTLAENPHLRFYNNRRGYVRTRFTAQEMTADFRVVPYVQRAGAPVEIRGSFAVEDRRPGLRPR
ncbi:alkaline phosphatase D family protein [Pseudonocardia bannensis]|uniref:alkaline phosphatase D family protein n=1 Tax=Pseudonocardia bannensis TaxID=630973 RepID=UPI003F68A48A